SLFGWMSRFVLDLNLISLADSNSKPIFQLSFLDQLPANKSHGLLKTSDEFSDKPNLRRMILPETME
ncbi:MAG: hypothetical protein V4591_12045, partial [Bdellovibrionota bacterium]